MPEEVSAPPVNPGVRSVLAGMEGLLDSETIGQLKTDLKIQDTPPATPAAAVPATPAVEAPAAGTPPATPPAAEGTPPATPDANTSAATPEALKTIEVDSPLYGGKHDLNKKKDPEAAISGFDKVAPEDMKAFLKPFGVDSMEKLVTSVNKFRADSEKLTAIEEKNTKYEEVWEKMPDDLFESVQAWARNEDYRKVITSRPEIDFNKDINEVDSKVLVDTYFKGQFTQEEWDDFKDPEGSAATKKAIKIAIEQSKDKFSLDKNKFATKRADLVKQQNERMQKIDASIAGSVNLLTEKLPGLAPSYIENVVRVFRSGGEKDLYRAKDGTLLPEAVLRYALAEHGLGLIEQLQGIAANAKETEVNQDILTRGADQGRGKGAADTQQPSAPFQNFVDNVLPKQKKPTY